MLNIHVSSASVHTSQTTHPVTMATVLVCITMYHRQNTAIVVTMTTYKHPQTPAWAQTWASGPVTNCKEPWYSLSKAEAEDTYRMVLS
jgi:hypothetical protein